MKAKTVAAVAAAVLIAACGEGRSDFGTGIAPPPPPPPGPNAPVSVSITASAFVPASITLSAGRSVSWVNNTTVPMTLSGNDGSFTSNAIAPGASFQRAFPAAGTFTINASGGTAPFSGTVNVIQ